MKPEEVLETIERVAVQKGFPIIGPKRGTILDEVIDEHKPRSILEVGTLVGYSAIRMAKRLGEGGKVTCVEVREEMARAARSNFEKAGLSDNIDVIVGDAKEVLPRLGGDFDMVFLDAIKEDYIVYLRSVERLLHTGSVVVADNVKSHADEAAVYLDYVRNSGKFSSEYRESKDSLSYGTGLTRSDAVEISVRL